jgi:predicted TIM-barrel fold metal-dependent hydrolase
MFSVDHPFANSDQATAFLKAAPVTESEREQIAHQNVESLLGIEG